MDGFVVVSLVVVDVVEGGALVVDGGVVVLTE